MPFGGAHNPYPFSEIHDPRDEPRIRQREADRLARGDRTETLTAGPYDLIGVAGFSPFLRWETSDFEWGTLFVSSATHSTTVPYVQNHAEIQVVGSFAGAPILMFAGALTQESALGGTSSGPAIIPIRTGEMPDSIEVFARGRFGAAAAASPSSDFPDNRIQLYATGRFHR